MSDSRSELNSPVPNTGVGRSRSARDQTPDQQFWHLWRQGRRPDLRTFLTGQGGIAAEDYLALRPPGPESDQAGCDIVYGEYLLREQLGEHPSLEEYQRRFPT